jgi:hypothetical protein
LLWSCCRHSSRWLCGLLLVVLVSLGEDVVVGGRRLFRKGGGRRRRCRLGNAVSAGVGVGMAATAGRPARGGRRQRGQVVQPAKNKAYDRILGKGHILPVHSKEKTVQIVQCTTRSRIHERTISLETRNAKASSVLNGMAGFSFANVDV